ncbi:MAG TPA: CRTAC1 family protein [Thermoanaerobaculia bacterium]|nr:CRTAC1 family protein [Thermoanaerobaculia bacterium]
MRRRRRLRCALATSALAASALATACAAAPPATPERPAASTGSFALVDVAPRLGLADRRWRGRMRDAKIIATVGGGVAWGDADGDGDLDLWLTQGMRHPDRALHPANCGTLLRNDGPADAFVAVTAAAGLAAACGWGMGALFEDLDNDGDLDLLLTFLGEAQAWRNRGDGSFSRQPLPAAADGWLTGAAALDADGDGDLDLYLSRYLDTDFATERARPAFALLPLEAYPPRGDLLLLQERPWEYRAAPEAAIAAPVGRGLTVVAADFDRDGRPDLYVANDRDRNTLLRGRGDGTFADLSEIAGAGYGLDGGVEAGMGVAVADLDGNGWQDLVVTNFAGEPANLFLDSGGMAYRDASRESGLYAPSHPWLGWAAIAEDLDDDGRRDLLLSHGHLMPSWVGRVARWKGQRELVDATFRGPFRQPLLLLANAGGRFLPQPVPWAPGVWRGGAAADYDGDGRVDVLLYSSDRRTPTRLLHNRTQGSRWLEVRPRRPGAAPPGAGLEVTVTSDGRAQVAQVVSGGSYLSGSAAPLHFGLGGAPAAAVEAGPLRGAPRRRFTALPAERVIVLP